MKVAISTDGYWVSAHFGRCPSFTMAEIKDGKIVTRETIHNPGHHPGYLPEFLHAKGVDYIVAGGMGQRAQLLFNQHNIETVMGVAGNIDEILDRICLGTLQGGQSLCNPGDGKGYGLDKTACDHEEHHHH